MTSPDDTAWNGTSADWSDQGAWSNGIPNSLASDAAIAINGSYTVTITAAESYAIDALLFSASGATLLIEGTLDTTQGVDFAQVPNLYASVFASELIVAGSLGGPVTAGLDNTLAIEGGALQSLSPDVTLAGGALIFADTLNNSLLVTNAASLASVYGDITAAGLSAFDNSGAINGITQLEISAASLINSGLIGIAPGPINTGDDLSLAGAFTNASRGTVSGIGTSSSVEIENDFTNAGLITITGGVLALDSANTGSWTNTGTIAATDAAVQLGGDETAADFGTFSLTGSAIEITGTYENAGQTLNAGSGLLVGATLDPGGTIAGGTLDAAALGLVFGPQGSVLNNGTYEYEPGALAGVTLIDGLTVSGAVRLEDSPVYADAGATLGTITVAETYSAATGETGYLEIDSGTTIGQPINVLSGTAALDGDFTLTGNAAASSAPVTFNPSYIITAAGTIELDAGLADHFVNAAVISAADGGVVVIGGDESVADLGSISLSGGYLDLAGTLETTGGTLNAADSVLAGATLDGGTIIGGALDAAALGLNFANGFLEDVTIIGGLTLASGTAYLQDGSTVVAGTGPAAATITLSGTLTYNEPYLEIDTAPGATLDQPIEVLGGIAALAGDFTLAGNVFATGAQSTIVLGESNLYNPQAAAYTFVNQATVTAAAGATVVISGDETAADLGAIARSGGSLVLAGTLENAGQTLNAASTLFAGAVLQNGTISGGTLDAGAVGVTFTNGALEDVALINGLSLSSGYLALLGTSAVYADAAATALAAITLGGTGELNIDQSSPTFGNQVVLQGGDLYFGDDGTIGAGDGISGDGQISGAGTVTNLGTIAATTLAGQQLALGGASFINDGLITGNANFEFEDTASNAGTITAGAGQTAELYSNFSNTGVISVAGGTLDIGDPYFSYFGYEFAQTTFDNLGAVSVTNGTLLLGGDESLADLGDLSLAGSKVYLDGTLENAGGTLNGSGTSAFLTGATLGGGGVISGGTLDAAALGLALNGGALSDAAIINGLTLSGTSVTLENGSTVYADAGATPGTVFVESGGGLTYEAPSSGTINQAIDVLSGTASVSGGTLESNITASGAAATLALTGLTNYGQVSVTGGLLEIGYALYYYDGPSLFDGYALDATFDNQGTISVTGSTVFLGGSESLTGLGDFSLSQSALYVGGTLDAAGDTLDGSGISALLTGATLISGGTIAGGTMTVAALGLALDGGALSGVTIFDGLTFTGHSVTLENGTAVFADAGTTAGTIVIDSTLAGATVFYRAPDSGTIGQAFDVLAGTLDMTGAFTLDSVITASGAGAVVSLSPASVFGSSTVWENLGTIIVENGATLDLSGDESYADFGTIINQGGTVEFSGTLENAGVTLAAADTGLRGVVLNNATISGGAADLDGLGAVLEDVVLEDTTIINGLTLGNGHVTLAGGSEVYADAGSTIGTITLAAAPVVYSPYETLNGTSYLQIDPAAPGAAIGQPVLVLDGTAALTGDFTLTGDLSASGSYATIALDGPQGYDSATESETYASWVNLGAVTLSGGASLYLTGDETAADLGIIRNDGGTVWLADGTYENAGSLLGSLSTALQGAVLGNVTIEGGTFDQAGLNISFSGADLDNVAILGGLNITGSGFNSDYVYISGATTLVPAGTVVPAFTAGANGGIYFADAANETLTNALSLAGGFAQFEFVNAASLAVIAATAAVTGYGNLNDDDYNGGTLLNAGTIEALGGNLEIYLYQGVFDDSGAVIAGRGGDLDLDSPAFAGNGLVIAENGGIVQDYDIDTNNALLAGGTFEISASSQLQFFYSPEIETVITLSNGTLSGAGNYYYQDYNNLTVEAGGVLTGSGLVSDPGYYGNGTIYDSGTIAAAAGRLTIEEAITGAGTLTIGIGATLELGGDVTNNVTMTGGANVLQLDNGGTLFTGTVENFTAGDQLVIDGFEATSATFANNLLTLANAGAQITVALDGDFAPGAFATTLNSNNQTAVQLGRAGEAVTIAAPASLFGNAGMVTQVSGITITDSLDTQISVQLVDQSGVLDANPANGALVQGGGTGTLVLSGGIAAVNQELASLEYQAPNNGALTDQIAVIAQGNAGDTSAVIGVTINQRPSFSLPAAVFLEPQAPGSLSGVTLQKSDAVAGEIFTVIAADQFDTLSGSPAGAGTLSGSGGAAVTLSGTLADINAMLAGLTISGQQDDILTLSAADGLGGSVVAELAADLDLPAAINGPGTFVATLDVPESNLGFSITDPYAAAGGETLGLTLTAGTGTLASGGTSGQAITFSGTVAELNADLAALTYTAAEQGQSLDPIGITVIDQHGGTATALIDALDIGQPPSFSTPGDVLLQSGTPGAVPGLSLNKFEPLPGEEFTVYLYDQSSAIFASSADGGAAFGAGSNLVTLTGSLAAINAELASISVTGAADDTLSLLAGDSDAGTATASVPLDVNIPASIKAPADFLAFGGSAASNLGISLTDPYVAALGETLAVTVQDVNGTLSSSSGSGNGTGTISFSGSVAQVNQFLGNIVYTAPADPLFPDFIGITAADPSGGTGSAIIDVIPPDPPTLNAPSLAAIAPGLATPIDGVSVEGGANEPGNTPITIEIDAGEGFLGIGITSGVSVINNYSNQLELVGEAAALNTALSSLVYLGGTETSSLSVDGQPQVDELYVAAIEGGATAASLVTLSAPTLSGSATLAQPVLVLATDENPLSAALLQWEQDNAAFVGTLFADLPGYYGASQQTPPISFLLTGFDSTIPVQLPGGYYGAGPSNLTSTGTLEPFAPVVGDWVSSYGQATAESLGAAGEGSPVQFTITSTDLGAKQPDQITYIIGSKSGATLLPDRRLTIVFNKPGGSTSSPSSSSTSSAPTTTHGGGGGGGGKPGGGAGDVHLTTFDGLHYDFQAAGEFVLAKSTAPGDSYQVQIRLQPWYNSASVSVTTEIAAAVGSNRVTFDLTRADTVWVNGAAVALADGQHYDLGAGTLVQLSATSWDVLWDSGETLTVSNAGDFLDYTTTLAKHAAAGSVQGLLGNDNGNPGNDLVLPDGTVLRQPVSFSELYTTFANAWRVTQSTSLLDYGAGQTTASFTDTSFPSDSTSLASIPANVLENAVSLVTAAGITNPAQQQAAIEDYLLTGDPAFISADAQQVQTSATILQTPANPAQVSGLGIEAPETSIFQSPSGTTAVTFTVYTTGTSASAQILAYSLITGAGYLSAQDFPGDVLPTGFVTLAAGQNSVNFTLDVTGTIGAAGAEQLAAVITPVTTTEAILDPSAYVSVLNSTPVEGTDAQVAFRDAASLGTLSGSGENVTLDLGAIGLGQALGAIDVELVNAAGTGADTLSGLFVNSGAGFNFASGLAEVVGLAPGADSALAFTVQSGTLGEISDVLSFSAQESNPSGYSAGIGIYNLTINADIVPEPLIRAPAQDIAPFGQPGTLSGISLAAPAASYASEGVTVTITDSAGTLAIGTPGAATLTGDDSTQLVISGSLAAVNAALGTLEFTGTRSDSVTLAAAFTGGVAATRTIGVIASPPGINAAGFIAADGSPAAVGGASIADPFAQEDGEFVTLTVTDATGLLAAAGPGFTGDGSSTLVFTGTVPLINQDLSTLTYTRLATGFAPEPIFFALTDPAGQTASTTILAAAPTIQLAAPSGLTTPLETLVPVTGIVITDPAAASTSALVTATLAASDGDLSVTGTQNGTLSGNGSGTIILSGSLAAVNADLAAVHYLETATSGTITLSVGDPSGNQAAATIATSDEFLSVVDNLPSTLSPEIPLQTLLGIISTAVETSPAVNQPPPTATDFSQPVFFTAIGQAQTIVSESAQGQAITSGVWSSFVENLFSSIGVTYSSSELDSIGTTLAAIAEILSAPSGGSEAVVSGLSGAITAGAGNGLSGLVSGLTNLLENPENAGNLSNLIGGATNFSGSINNSGNVTNIGGLVGGLVDLGLFAGGLVSKAAGTASGVGGAFASAYKLYQDYNNPNANPADVRQDLINFDVGMAGLAINVAVAAGFISPITYAVIAGGLLGYGLYQAFGKGDVHLTTLSGQLYDFQAEGEFTLVQSTLSGNSFNVQARLQPWTSGASVSVMTEIGAAVGTDRVTFAVGRAATVWVDGQASTLGTTNPLIQLNGGVLMAVSPTEYAILWNTGELITVTNEGTYLDVAVALGPNDGANSTQGLLGPNNGAANDFELPDGTVLTQPLTSTELYTTFADAWRITQANSLLDYGTGQTTATFTDTNFPSDAISLKDLPAALVAQAASVVAAAGITNPAEAAAAELDYIATGNLTFVNSDAQDFNTSTTSVPVTETTAPPASSGIYAPNTVVSEASPVAFTAYLTNTAASAVVLDWTVTVPDDSYIGTVAFVGTLPAGTVTIAAGQTVQNFAVTLSPGILGSLASENLQVVISATDSTPVFSSTAQVEILNSTAEPGAGPAPEFLETSGTGILLPNANGYALDLGTVFTGETIGQILLALENSSAPGADLLGGSFGTAYGAGFSLSGETPLSGIAGGGSLAALTITANTSVAGAGQENVFFYPTDSNATGYNADLSPIELTLTDTVENVPTASISNETINFGTIHVGDTASALLSISNAATAPAAGLDATITALAGDASGAGAFTTLAPGATDDSDISAGLNTGTAGVQTGSVILGLAADSGTSTEALPSATISLSGTVLNYATAAITNLGAGNFVSAGNAATLDLGVLPLGTNAVIDLGVLNAASGPADLLEGSFSTSGGAGFNNAGLQGFSGIGAGGTAQALVTLSTGAGGSFAETISLASTGYDSGFTGTLTPQTIVIEADAPAPPVLAAPTITAITPGIESAIDGLSVQSGSTEDAETPVTLSLAAANGALALKFATNVAVSGNGTGDLTLTGAAAAINTALSSLIYTGGAVSGTGTINGAPQVDTIKVTASEDGATTTSAIAVSAPTISSLLARPVGVLATDADSPFSSALLQFDQNDLANIGTLYVSLPAGYGAGTQTPSISLLLAGLDNLVPVTLPGGDGADPATLTSSATLEPYAPLTGSWASAYGETIQPSLIDTGAGSPVQFTVAATDSAAALPDTITYLIQSTSGTVALPDERVTVVFETQPGIVGNGIISAGSSQNNAGPVYYQITEDGPDDPDDPDAGGDGDVHLKTFSGLRYDFQAAGEFVLAKSTTQGDSYQVQVRLQPWYNSASVSVMTEVAAAVGSDRVTFGLARNGTVWVNGAAVSLSGSTPMQLSGGTLQQISGASWQIVWNTGETLTVSNAGSFLNAETTLAANAAAGSVQGLLGTDSGNPATDLALPDGTIISQPVSYSELYTTYANAWRITQGQSLFDYGNGQGTATYTDLNFPADNVPLSSLPANLVENALSLVAAAGITDPGAQQAAAEDYLLTGDASFISADAQNSQSSSALLANPVNPNAPPGLGIGADAASVVQSGATTAIGFTAYATEISASPQIIDYAVISTGGTDLSAVNFAGGVLPSGTVTIAAGQTAAAFTIDVTGALTLAAETLAVTITTPGTQSIIDPAAFVVIGNTAPVEGIDADPQFIAPPGGGAVSGTGDNVTLDLGTFALGAAVTGLGFDIVNAATGAADILSGLLEDTGSSLISFAGGLGPVTNLAPGDFSQLEIELNTGTAGELTNTLTFNANESNPSGYSALLGNETLTIEADIVPAPIIFVPVQDVVQAGTAGALADISVTVGSAIDASTPFTVTAADSHGLLAILSPDGATITGGGTNLLTLTGSLTAINTALQSLAFTGTQNDIVTLTADFAGSGDGSASFQVSANQPPAFSGPGTLDAFFGVPAALTGVTLSDPDGISANETLAVTLADNTGTLTGTALDGGSVSGSGTQITLTGGLIAVDAELAGVSYTAAAAVTSDTISLFAADGRGGSATGSLDVLAEAACFAAGTRILTAQGRQVRVEQLREGDEVETCSGPARIIWIGRRTLAPRRHPRPEAVQPILITAGALGDGLPGRDLVVSPDHAMYLEGHLIPAKALINGFTIRQLNCGKVTYYHIELRQHAVLFAEGAAAESYLETGNRAAFENGMGSLTLHPDFAQSVREQSGCAPFAESGPAVETVRQRILDRAGIETTYEPDLQIRYENGQAIIASRSAIPGEIFADPRDRRRLGVKIGALKIGRRKIALDHPALIDGWHGIEPDGRWTNGCAVIPKSIMGGAKTVKVTLASSLLYPLSRSSGKIRLKG